MNGPIGWFARNAVAANLLMVFIIAAGLVTLATRVPLEVFPSFELERVAVSTTLRGATPGEVEDAVTVRVEEAIGDLAEIKRIESLSREGASTVTLELQSGSDAARVAREVERRLAALSALPAEAETPVVTVPEIEREVISVVVAASLPEGELVALASRLREELEALPEVASVAVSGARRFELAIEIPELALERHGLTLAGVRDAIESASLDLPAGALRTDAGEVLLRTAGQARTPEEFARIPLVARADGTRLLLGDIAEIRDGFEESALEQRFDGQRSVEIEVYRRGLQSAIAVSDAVKRWIAETRPRLPPGVELGYWRDSSRAVRARLETLLSSALQGGLLIVLLLTLFLRFWIAFWVFVGVPVSILGGIALMPALGVSLNLISLFAFILVLGIVVDDAIVTGENIYTHMRRRALADAAPLGGARAYAPVAAASVEAAIAGTREVAVPVTFGVLTTVAAFVPLLLIEGARGQIFAQIPLIVIPVLLFSLVESKLVLPAHMSHLDVGRRERVNPLVRVQRAIADGFERFVLERYRPFLALCLEHRYTVLAVFVGGALVVFSLIASGQLRFVFFPRVQSEVARAYLEMPDGTPFESTREHITRIVEAAQRVQARHIDPESGESVIESILSSAGGGGEGGAGETHRGRVLFEIVPPEERALSVTSRELVAEWRREIGAIPGAESLSFRAEIGRGGSPIDVELSGRDFGSLREAAALVRAELARYAGVTEISDSFEGGKEEVRVTLGPEAERFGLSLAEVAAQLRAAYLGAELPSVQRDRDEVRVTVRLPRAERESLASLERLTVRAPDGAEVPLASVATLERGRGFSTVRRVDRRRTVNVEADVDKATTDVEAIKADLERFGETLRARFPDVALSLEGEAREQRESFASLRVGLVFVLLAIYTLLAVPFGSYLQPLLVMVVIPFGVVGGALGHLAMGMPLSIMSYMGMLALCGVVVNDSLVLVDWVNRRRREGMALIEAVRAAGTARFRAVVLTSLTTFFGLVPLILEDSTQAQFLIPMAVSLGFGILFATLVTLILIPVNYLVLEDLRALAARAFARAPSRGRSGA